MSLIVIEGLDGAGKSTQTRLLRDNLLKNGEEVENIHFPRTESPFFGELIAKFLRGEYGNVNEVDPWLVAMLYACDRNDAAAGLREWLTTGKTVLLDRYTYSNIAYQCAKVKDERDRIPLREWILKLEFEHFGIPIPDINIFLDVPFRFTEEKLSSGRQGEDRNYLLGRKDIHEADTEFQKKVREVYLDTAITDNRLVIINCSDDDSTMLPPDEIFARIVALLKERGIMNL